MSIAELVKVKGVGKSIAEKIREFVDTGTVAKLERLAGHLSAGLRRADQDPGPGSQDAQADPGELGVETLEDLRRPSPSDLRTLPGLGKPPARRRSPGPSNGSACTARTAAPPSSR
jgi:DNA polymerase (family X)